MNGRLLLSFAVATFIAALATVWVLADVRRRMDAWERERGAPAAAPTLGASRTGTPSVPASPAVKEGPAAAAPEPASRPSARPAGEAGEAESPPMGGDPLASKDPLDKLNHLIQKLEEMSNNQYDVTNDVMTDLMALKREVRQLKATLRAVAQAMAQGGHRPAGLSLGWGLATKGAPLGAEVIQAYVADAEKHGIQVEQGRVTAKAMLNMSPNKQMPIEYFITRYPESGHETLVHLTGGRSLEELAKDPVGGLRGLGNALYKALVAAGFAEGEGTRPDPASEDARRPRWLLPTGDVVYLYVRYERAGTTHLARATDWVIDPSTGGVLPDDAFRFTGSIRGEDPDTGDEVLAAELGGLLVSVWPNARALLEVALDSAVHNDYQYNSARIPKPDGEGPLVLDLIFSKSRLELSGDGAAPLEPVKPPVAPAAPAAPAVPVAPEGK